VGVLHYFLRQPVKTSDRPALLLFFLHGVGERGNADGSELYKVREHGPWKCVGADQFFILAPQCSDHRVWSACALDVLKVLFDVLDRHHVDRSRIYITGHAFGAWSVAVTRPWIFAAIVPICGGIAAIAHLETGCPSRNQMLRMAAWVRTSME